MDVIGQSLAMRRRRAVAGRDRRRRARHRRAVRLRRPAAVDLRAIRSTACHGRHDCRAIDRRRRARRAGLARGDPQGRSRSLGRRDRHRACRPHRPVRAACGQRAWGRCISAPSRCCCRWLGLFGVQSHVVSYRTREIGVRMSVGASARQIKLMVIKDGYRPVIEGLILGLWGGLAGRVIARCLSGRRRECRRSVDAADHTNPADPRCVLRVLSARIPRRECRSDRGASLRIVSLRFADAPACH